MIDGKEIMSKNEYSPYVETVSGKKVTFMDANPDDIDIHDIAYALANQCRFNGHCSQFYSVAEHSVAVASLLPKELQLAGLLHDAAEAYLGDIPSPIKQYLPDFNKIEDNLLDVILRKYDVDVNEEGWDGIKRADMQQLRTEAWHLIPSKGQDWLIWETPKYQDLIPENGNRPIGAPPQYAYRAFMGVFESLTGTERSRIIMAA